MAAPFQPLWPRSTHCHPQDDLYLSMWIRAMDDMAARLLFTTPSGELTYVGEIKHKPTWVAECVTQYPVGAG